MFLLCIPARTKEREVACIQGQNKLPFLPQITNFQATDSSSGGVRVQSCQNPSKATTIIHIELKPKLSTPHISIDLLCSPGELIHEIGFEETEIVQG